MDYLVDKHPYNKKVQQNKLHHYMIYEHFFAQPYKVKKCKRNRKMSITNRLEFFNSRTEQTLFEFVCKLP